MKFTWPKFLTFKKRPKPKSERQVNSDSEASEDEEVSALRNRSVTPFAPPTVAARANRTIPFTPIAPRQSNARLTTDTASNESLSSGPNIYLTPTVSQTSHSSRPMTPAIQRLIRENSQSQPERSGTPFQVGMTGRVQCQGLTQKGLQCKLAAVEGSYKCRMHK